MSDQPLTTNPDHPIIRRGDQVHRPSNFWTPAVHDLLKYLESVGFAYSPKVIGLDNEGREVLSYFEGESGRAGWFKIISDDGLRKYARLLRRYHDAVRNYKPPGDTEWASGATGMQDGEIICHGDFGPWNIVWHGDDPVGIVDWDIAHPAAPEYDILYALEYSAPFRDDKAALEFHHFPEVPDRRHRIDVFLEAYGALAIPEVANKVAVMQRTVGEHEAYLAGRGIQPQAEWVANGDLDVVEKRARWTEENAALFLG